MATTINERVRALVQSRGLVQKDLAVEIGMTTDALSRALSGQRGFGATELARIAELLDADVHQLITGDPDPARLRLAARHSYDRLTTTYSNATADADEPLLADIRLAYAQAYPAGPPRSDLPADGGAVREALGRDFVRHLADRLEERLGVDVVRIPRLGTAYSMLLGERAVIVIAASGNWYRENWDIAHELGHVVTGAMSGAAESAANAFAARLLLPERAVHAVDWTTVDVETVGRHLWDWGVSTEALRNRLLSLGVPTSPDVDRWLSLTTPGLLRGQALPATRWTALAERQREAAARRFPPTLVCAHERAIAEGRVGKGTLAWMLGVDADTLEVAEPEVRRGSVDGLADLLGLA
jgi:transcriptional regulator with XRE-family HTH domain